jgi:DNA-binding transcriptional regulator YiaG
MTKRVATKKKMGNPNLRLSPNEVKQPDEAQKKAREARQKRFRSAFDNSMSPEMLGVKVDTLRHWKGGRWVPPEAAMILMTFYRTMGPEAYTAVWRMHQRAVNRKAA